MYMSTCSTFESGPSIMTSASRDIMSDGTTHAEMTAFALSGSR